MMSTATKIASADKPERISPRERILAAASDLFYRHGIRAVGVEAIAEAAKTNKMTLYRHFPSKDELVAEYLRCLAAKAQANWDRREADHPGDPLAQTIKEDGTATYMGTSGRLSATVNSKGVVEPPSNRPVQLDCFGKTLDQLRAMGRVMEFQRTR